MLSLSDQLLRVGNSSKDLIKRNGDRALNEFSQISIPSDGDSETFEDLQQISAPKQLASVTTDVRWAIQTIGSYTYNEDQQTDVHILVYCNFFSCSGS